MTDRRATLVPLLLFVATFATTTVQGALYVHGDRVAPLWDGLSYSVPLLSILVCHELGHWVAARVHGVPASLPYFIPLPPPIGPLGTMGAVIFQTSTLDRKKLFDIGVAGPLAGLLADPGLAAQLALAGALPELPFACGLGTAALLDGDLVADCLLPVNGQLPVPRRAPEPDPKLVAAATPPTEVRQRWLDRLRRVHALLDS